jgi:Secretion system C-terminal sorting domain
MLFTMKNYILTITLLFCALTSGFTQFSSVASGFIKPAGIETDDSGNVLVTETGTGANDARVVMVRPNGDKIPIITGLPSFTNARVGGTTGAVQTLRLANNRLAVLIGEGSTISFGRIMLFNMTGFQAGVSPAKSVADTTSTLDVSRFVLTQTTVSNPFSMAIDKDGNWYVVDAGANLIVKITPTGQRSVFTTFPRIPNGTGFTDAVPTKIITKPDGGFYVCTYTGFPFVQGRATIYSLNNAGVATPYVSNMTLLTDIQLDPRTGDLYALQYGTFAQATGYAANSSRVFRIGRDGGTPELVDGNFGPGVGLALDRAGTIYVTSLGAGLLLKKSNATRCFKLDFNITNDNGLILYNSIKFSLSVKNNDAAPATNVRIFWLPPYKRFEGDAKPYAQQGFYQSKGRYDGWNGFWVIPRLEPGETATAYQHLFVVNPQLDATQIFQVANCNEQNPNFLPYFKDENEENVVAFKNNPTNRGTAFSVSPNPANEKISVVLDPVSDTEWTVKLRNTLGQTLFSQKGNNNRSIDIDSKNLHSGLYIVEYQSEGERKTSKVLIQH